MKLSALICICFFILSCGKSPEDTTENQHSFKVIDLNLESTTDDSSSYSFPDFVKKYKLSATIIDSSTLAPVPNVEFKILLGDEGALIVTSDPSGRIYWNEVVKFNLLNQKNRILVERTIAFLKDSTHFEKVKYSFYPYASYLEEDVSEFNYITEKNEEFFISKKQAQQWENKKVKINIRDTNLKIAYLGLNSTGGQYRIHLDTKIISPIKKKNNEDFDYVIKEGSFAVQFVVFETQENSKEKNILVNKVIESVIVKDNLLNINFEESLNWANQTANLQMALRIIPKSMSSHLYEFQGRYSLGLFKDITGDHTLVFEPSKNSYYSDFKLDLDTLNTKSISDTKNIYFSKLNLEYDMIENIDNPTRRSIIYRSVTCVSDVHSGQNFAFEKFLIQKTTGEVIPKEADGNGCLFWNERIEYKYYKPEKFFKRTNKITHLGTNISKYLVSYINPWTILTIGRDEIEMDKKTLSSISQREEVHPRLFLEDYYYETIGVTYHIDEYMTLFVRKNIQLNLQFKVNRYSSLTEGINSKEAIRDGVYLLKIAFEKSYIDTRKSHVDIDQGKDSVEVKRSVTRKPIEYIYVVNKLVRVWNGYIITPIELSIHDLRLMTVRSNLLIQLQTIEQNYLRLSKNFDVEELKTDRVLEQIKEHFPDKEPSLDLLVDNDSGLPSRTFVGPLVFLEIQGGADVRPTDAMNICETDDCNFIERNNPELQKRIFPHEKKYYSNMNYLAGTTVDKLTETKKVLDLKYRNQKVIESLFYNYLDLFNLSLVSNEPENLQTIDIKKVALKCDHPHIEFCLKSNSNRRLNEVDFIRNVISTKKEDIEIKLSDFYFPEKIKELDLSNRMCKLMVNNIQLNLNEKKRYNPRAAGLMLSKVRNEVKKLCEDSPYSFNKILRTQGINKFHFLGGKTVNFDLGSANSINFEEAFENENEISLNPVGLLGLYKATLGNLVSGLVDYNFIGRTSQEYAYSESSELTSTTYLSMQRASFDINFKEPLLCVEVRPKLKFAENLFNILQSEKYVSYNIKPMTEGFVVCDIHQSKAISDMFFREKYYYFAQHFTEGHMLDDGSILNHPWLMGLRGERDYKRFVSLLGIKPSTQERETNFLSKFFKDVTSPIIQDEKKLAESFTENNLSELPLDQISGAYDNVLPSFPGVYVITPHKKEYPYD
ncbi:MAG: hypothetical protein KDD58_12440 [Bdellovibrionales bacterium]|nr:hypothetical protein [Bdellovibrionales bacterium]